MTARNLVQQFVPRRANGEASCRRPRAPLWNLPSSYCSRCCRPRRASRPWDRCLLGRLPWRRRFFLDVRVRRRGNLHLRRHGQRVAVVLHRRHQDTVLRGRNHRGTATASSSGVCSWASMACEMLPKMAGETALRYERLPEHEPALCCQSALVDGGCLRRGRWPAPSLLRRRAQRAWEPEGAPQGLGFRKQLSEKPEASEKGHQNTL